MFRKPFIWRLLVALVLTAFLIVGGIALYRAGFTHGTLSTIEIPEGAFELGNPDARMPFGRTPLGWHMRPRVGIFGIFPGLLCFGGLFLMLMAFLGAAGMMRRRRFFHRDGPSYGHHGPPWGAPPKGWAPPEDQQTPPLDADEPAG